MDRLELLTNGVAKQICGQGNVDQETVGKFSKFTKIDKSMATDLVKELSNSATPQKYFQDVKFILELFIKNYPSIEKAFGSGYLGNVQQLMAVKTTIKPVYFKKQVMKLLSKVVTNSGYKNRFKKLTPQTQTRYAQFLAYYLTWVLRNLIRPEKK